MAVVLAVVVVLVGSAAFLFSARAAGSAPVVSPPPTQTPQSPGMVVATAHQDLSGAWMMPDGHQYVMFASTAFGNRKDNIPMFVGTPGHWSSPTDALPTMPPWALDITEDGLTWEPEVAQFGTRYVLYYAADLRHTSPQLHCIGTAVSGSLTGPYSASPNPIVCQPDRGGDIDPQVVRDRGRPYLVWKTDNNAVSAFGPPWIMSQPLAADGLSVVGSESAIYLGESAPAWARPIIEAPQLVASPDGGWWLFYSGGGGFNDPNYAIGVARCASVSGPCTPFSKGPLIASNRQGKGPGEETFLRVAGSDWLLYVPWATGSATAFFRPIVAARIGWLPSGPYVADNGSFPTP